LRIKKLVNQRNYLYHIIPDKYTDEIKKFLDEKISKEKQEKLNRLMKFAGKGEIYERFNNLTSREIREKVAKEKYSD